MIPHTNHIKDVNIWLNTSLKQIISDRERANYIKILNEDVLNLKDHFEQQEARISESQIVRLQDCIKRLNKNEPIQYVTGKVYFHNLVLDVEPGVLIPRPETEELVNLAIEHSKEGAYIIDLCTGSGCIALSLKKAMPSTHVIGLEKYTGALDQAKHNGLINGIDVKWLASDVFDDDWMLGKIGSIDMIVSNPPYIPERDKSMMAENVLQFEPEEALFVNNSEPLTFYERLKVVGVSILKSKGQLMCECHEDYADAVAEMFLQEFSSVKVVRDMQGKNRIVWAIK